MKNYRGIIARLSDKAIKNTVEALSLKAFADENPDGVAGDDTNNNQPTNPPTINYEDLIAKARKEEKDKQYKTIEKYKTQVNTLTEQHNSDLLKIADLEKRLETAETKLTKAGSGDSEETKTLKAEVETLKADKKSLEDKVKTFESQKPVSREEVEAEVRAELEAEYTVKTYKAEKMAELREDILVPELVMGTTKEEIDASIQSALARSEEIRKSLGIANGGQKQKRTPKSPANPTVSGVQDKEYSLEYLAGLDVRSPEYAEVRKNLGLK